jgi:hypothetical protein
MTDARPVRARVRLIGFIVLVAVAVQGCVHIPPPSPLPESLQQQLGKIGVVATTTEGHQAFDAPETGRLSDAWRGARFADAQWDRSVRKSIGHQGFSLWVGPLYLVPTVIIPVVGALRGAVASESWEEAETTFQTIVAELDLNQALPQHLVTFAQAHGYMMTHLSPVMPEGPQPQSHYTAARHDGIDTVLEIQDIAVNLFPAEITVNPHRRLIFSAHMHLIRTVDETVLDERVVTDTLGPELLLDEWTANHATQFRQEVQQAAKRLAEQITTEYFMLCPVPERVIQGYDFQDVHLKGLRLLYPTPAEFPSMAQSVDSLQPIMSWEPFHGSSVTYDLRVWRPGKLGPVLAYSRTSLDQASHKIEIALEPSSRYYWSVRAHFSEQGREQITDWSRRLVTYNRMAKILTLGILAVAHPAAEDFFVFTTPPPPSPQPQPAESQSQ